MAWQAKPGCAEHHRAAVERIANSFPVPWLLAPRTGEVFDNLEHCNRRLRAWAFVEGFDIVRNGGGTAANPSYRFRCIFHGIATRNSRKLEDRVERDEDGQILSKRQREATSARQLQCPWSALCSFKDIGKRGTGDKGFVLTVQCEDHQNHQLAEDPFQFPAHLKSSEEYLEAHRQAIKHREQVLPYSVSRRLIDAEDLGVVLSSRDYYNSVRKQLPDKAKPETIVALLRMLEDHKFVYTTRFEVEKDLTGKPISRKLVQLFFAHRKQLDAATRFVSDWVIIIDGTFNTNNLRLPLLVVVGVLSTNETFPVAFSYCPSESAASIGFVWSSLKEECFIPASAALPRVIIGDWAAGLTSSVPKAFSEARFQGCDWHAVGAMLKFYRGKTQNYTSEEIDGSGEKLLSTQGKADLRVPGLHHFSWVYIKSASLEELETNRAHLISLLRPEDKHYINEHWRKLEEQVIHYYTKMYANLGSTASQRGESYHPVVRKITNGQLSFEDSGKRLAATVLSILKDLATHEYRSMRSYDRRAQLDYAAFQNLLCTISNFALRKIEAEWTKMAEENEEECELPLGCRCELLHRWGLPCRHYLRRAYLSGQPIPRSLVHPRYWLQGPPIQSTNWQPKYAEDQAQAYSEPARVQAQSTGQAIMDLREQMEPEEKARFDRQIEAEQQKLIAIGRTHLELQAFPIGNPDPVPKPQFRKKKTHGVADARGLSGAEIAGLDLKAREALARKEKTTVTPDTDDEGVLVGLAGESQGGTSITLAIRSPEQPQQQPLVRGPWAAGPPIFRLFSGEPSAPPASTAPSRLADEAVGPKRKRQHTERYEESVEDGELDESQYAKIGRR